MVRLLSQRCAIYGVLRLCCWKLQAGNRRLLLILPERLAADKSFTGCTTAKEDFERQKFPDISKCIEGQHGAMDSACPAQNDQDSTFSKPGLQPLARLLQGVASISVE